MNEVPQEQEWTTNEPSTSRWPALRIEQLWTKRELIAFFALRDLRVRYKQAYLGAAWAGIQPLVGALTFTVLFNRLAHVSTTASSYFAFALLGFGAWTFFSSTIEAGSVSLLRNSELLTKVSFPRIVAPTSTLLPGMLDLSVALVLAVMVSLFAGGGFAVQDVLVGLPLGLAFLVLGVAGPVFFFSASVVKFRDAQTLVSFGLQFFLFASPVAYPPEIVPASWRIALYVSPLAGALGLLRAALVDTEMPSVWSLLLSGVMAVLGTLIGLLHFRRSELEFADII